MNRRRAVLLAVLAFAVLWLPAHPARPPLAGGDVYTHLGVARHLVRGDGFQQDVVYPLSLAFPFARSVPQPLVHRPPLYAICLVGPFLAADRDPERSLDWTRRLLWAGLAAVAAVGAVALAGDGSRWPAVGPWLILLFTQPLLVLLVDWGREEILAGLVLMGLWILLRRGDAPTLPVGRSVAVGLLTAALALLRPELVWIPILWWLALPVAVSGHARAALTGGTARRRLLLTVGVAVAVCLPWLVRNAVVTGSPFFSLQAHAEHLKMSPVWPSFTVYRQLEPQPLFPVSLLEDPRLQLGKAALGGLFLLEQLDEILPWSLWAVALSALAAQIVRRRRTGRSWPGSLGAGGLVAITFAVAMGLLSFFSASTRHLAPLVPVVLWEVCRLLDRTLCRWLAAPTGRAAGLVLLAGLALLVTPPRIGGWDELLAQARSESERVDAAVAKLRELPPGPIFTDAAAVLWRSDRAGVWAPLDETTEAWIRAHVPGMAEAPHVNITVPGAPDPTGGGLEPAGEVSP